MNAIRSIMVVLGTMLVMVALANDFQKQHTQKTEVMDSNHVTNCYHGYIITPNGEQLRDKDGRGMPCS